MSSSTPIRDWARQNGYEVGSRGMIPGAIVNAYCVAHNIGAGHAHPGFPVLPPEKPRRPPKPRVAYDPAAGWILQTGAINVRVPSWDAGITLAHAICTRYTAALQQYEEGDSLITPILGHTGTKN